MLVGGTEVDGVAFGQRRARTGAGRRWIEERLLRDRMEVRIGDETVAQWVDGVSSALQRPYEIQAGLLDSALDPEQQACRRQPLSRGRQLVDGQAAVPESQGLDPLGPVGRQVSPGDETAPPFQRRGQRGGDRAAIEDPKTLLPDPLQGPGQVRIAKQHAGLHRRQQAARLLFAAKPS